MFVLVLLAYALVVLFDTIPIYKDATRKEFWVSSGILAFSLIIAILFSLDVKLPSPAVPLGQLVKKIYGL